MEHILEDGQAVALTMNGTTRRLTRLSALDTLFAASGTVDIKVVQRGQEQIWELPIKSVDNEVADTLARPYRPKVPTKREYINGQWKTVIAEGDQEYQDKLAEYNRVVSYVWIFLALDIDIVDAHGEVVWSADNTICKIDEARAALKQMGLVDNHIITIMRAVRDLTSVETEGQASD